MEPLNPEQRRELDMALHDASPIIGDKLEQVRKWDGFVYWCSMLLTALTAGTLWLLIVDTFIEQAKWVGAVIGTVSFVLAIFSTRNPFGDKEKLQEERFRIQGIMNTVRIKEQITPNELALLLPGSAGTPLDRVAPEVRDRIWKATGRH